MKLRAGVAFVLAGVVLAIWPTAAPPAVADPPPVPAVWTSVSAGDATACAVDTEQHIWCWGRNSDGQVGDGTTEIRTLPVRVGSSRWLSVRTSGYTSCGIRVDRTAWCWGRNAWGEVGNNNTQQEPVTKPEKVNGAIRWAKVRPGISHTCGISTTSALYCWGNDQFGQMGDGPKEFGSQVPVRIGTATTWTSVTAGDTSTCALTISKAAFCWGQEASVGTGTTGKVPSPTRIVGTWKVIDAGGFSACGITTRDVTKCWGYNGNGKLGTGDSTNRTTPTALAEQSHDFSRLLPGFQHACGVRTADGQVYCVGKNALHQFGNGTTDNSLVPVAAAGGKVRWSSLSVGGDYACGIRNAGKLFCWGDNTEGQLGMGSKTAFEYPVQVGGPQA